MRFRQWCSAKSRKSFRFRLTSGNPWLRHHAAVQVSFSDIGTPAAACPQMRSYVEANQEIGRLHARSRDVPQPDAEPSTEPEWDLDLIERAINGLELPDYAEVPDSGNPTGPPITA
jgi:hypothetical protein